MVKDIWGSLNLEREQMALAAASHDRDAVEFILKTKENRRTLMIIALWFTWNERNLIREEGRRSPDFIAPCIKSYVVENAEILGGGATTVSRIPRRKEKWSKPPPGFLKLNCDASFLPSSSSGSWGFLIQDCDGDVVVSGRGKIYHLPIY